MNETNVNPSSNDSSKFNFQESKSALKQQFSRLSDEDMEAIEMNPESAAARIQNVYGYSREKAIEEFNNFKNKNTRSRSGGSSGSERSDRNERGSSQGGQSGQSGSSKQSDQSNSKV
jgi:uncharacterized protein YjbJ (UPF0337 family)